MMKYKFLILSILTLGLSLSSCEKDYLNTTPTGSVDAGSAYATTKNAKAAINGIYRSMMVRYRGSQGHSGFPALMIINDVMGEDLVFANASNGWHFGEQRWLSHRSDVGTMALFPYEMFYRFIANANVAIANIDNAVGLPAERDQLKGEALAFRGFSYFYLVQYYGKRYDASAKPNSGLGVPLVLEPTQEGLPRSTVEEVYAQINTDLEAAAALLTTARSAKSHFNKNVLRGIQARVALAQQDWAKAATFAAEARQGFTLMSIAQYQDGFADVSNPEWMWGFDHLEDQSEFFGGYHSYISCNYNASVIRQTPKTINKLIYDLIPATDVRAKMWVKAPTAANAITPPGGVRAPYMVQKFRLPGTPSTSVMGDVPFMRAGEMYLIEAEAKAKSGDDAGAAKALFDMVSKRDPSYVLSTKTGAELLDEIYFNRRIELWGEGHRWLDLKRLNLPLDRNGIGHLPAVAQLFEVPAGDVRWEYLLPRAELDANKAAVQNPL
ncbi:RagB/SusD family nutrient uptake outer membrane protein [Haliscomenobacter sp.]|uniref:RagB/SusD family nutrient uptake outer membrane protein n=1 Tax=Haliscomenobacter sp. TaxID=2717303 RepID=UPI00359381E0